MAAINRTFKWALGLILVLLTATTSQAQNVGIGTASPNSQLSIVGRARIRHNVQTAGIYFDGSTQPTRSFIGMLNDDYVGIYGAGSGWSFVMHAGTGNVGIGTTAPTAKLDVNGGFRYEPGFPDFRAVLMSTNASGDAEWIKPVAFGVSGNANLANFTVPNDNTWYKVAFSSIADYNAGFAWQPVNQVFVAPLDGVYHFGFHMQHTLSIGKPQIRLVRRRNNVNTPIFMTNQLVFASVEAGGYTEAASKAFDGSCEVVLESNDQVWLEVNGGYTNSATFFGDKKFLQFNGRLLFVQ